ncbi:hypothetical protein O0L34_g4646 [Tuta absoluta]|nr:hypothetical protein O0L34_g4646 [Tuta absoluta]
MGFTALLILAVASTAFAQDSSYLSPYHELHQSFELRTTNLDEPAYRLKNTIQPQIVKVDLDVYLEQSRFDGVVTHEVVIQEAGLTQIVLHQNVVEINSVSVWDVNSNPVALQTNRSFEIDSYFEILKINLASAIPAGNYTITISYLGQIQENPLDRGFYKGYYYLGNQRREYATTQFQPFHARKAFPCFDEPQFKSRYTLSITRSANLSQSYSNMAIANTETLPNGRVRETFLPTPIISAYLIAFHVSDFVATTSTSTPQKPFGIISRPGVNDQHAFAAEMGFDITVELDEYLGINYYEMGQGTPMKNDHIALPDFPSGAMENWGMVNYREAYLLNDPANTNLQNRIFIATILAHELGHKWFGNLVTCFWWGNLWLNESFASFFEYFAPHWVDETLELADQFVVDHVHSALNWDAGLGATPMNWTGVVDNPSVSSHFSVTSYAKGASVLKMLEHFVGWRTFRNALRYYLRDNSYGIGTPADMYAAFRIAVNEDRTFASRFPGIDVGQVFDSWVQQAGSPVINVNVTGNGQVVIAQERFLINGNVPNALWQVPISWTHSGNLNFANTTPAFVLTTRTNNNAIQIPAGQHFVILNIQQSGLYRVNYDDNSWRLIAQHLRNNSESIHYLNRAQIVNDVLYFVRADKINISRAFDVLEFMRNETNYYVWSGALSQLDLIRSRLRHLPSVYEEYRQYLLGLMNNAINEMGYSVRDGDSTSVILNRAQIMAYACNILRHEGCRNYSLTRWNQYRNNGNVLVNPNERRYVYCVGINEGNASDYNFLFQKYNTSQNTADMVVILRTLGCTKDSTSFQHYLQQSLYNDRIRVHDRTNHFSFALQGEPTNLDAVLNFVYTRYGDIERLYGGVSRLNTAISSIAAYLTDFTKITEFQSWLYANQLNLPGSFSTGVSVINSAIANLEWGNSIAVRVLEETKSRNSATTFTSPLIVLAIALIAHLLK